MKLILEIAAFVLGIWLSIRLITALHGIIDFWYMIGTAYPRVAGRIIGWGAPILLMAWLPGSPCRTAFVWGCLFFLLFYLSLFPLWNGIVWMLRRGRSHLLDDSTDGGNCKLRPA